MGLRSIQPAIVQDVCDRCGAGVTSRLTVESSSGYPGQLERLPPGWSLMGRYIAASPHPLEWLLCPTCTEEIERALLPGQPRIMFSADQAATYEGKPDSYIEEPGLDDVPEGAEARGGGVVVAPHPICDIDGCGQEAMIDGLGGRILCVDCAADSLGLPARSPEHVMLEALRSRTAASRARQRQPCEGPLHIAGALGTCSHLGWFTRGDHTVCLPCAKAYDEVVRSGS